MQKVAKQLAKMTNTDAMWNTILKNPPEPKKTISQQNYYIQKTIVGQNRYIENVKTNTKRRRT